MSNTIAQRIKELKKNYRFEIVKEVTTDTINFGMNMCMTQDGHIFINGRNQQSIVVFDSVLNECIHFEQKFASNAMGVTANFIITSNWQKNTVGIYDHKGTFIRYVDTKKEIIAEMLPSVFSLFDDRIGFFDFRTNTIFIGRMKKDSFFDVEKKITIQEKLFYDPRNNTWSSLRTLVEHEGSIYTTGEGKLLKVMKDGFLEHVTDIPFSTLSIMGLVFHKENICIVDNVTNSVSIWSDADKKKHYSTCFYGDQFWRIGSDGNHIYTLKNNLSNNISIMQIRL